MDKVVEKRLVFVHMTRAFTFACLAALDSNSHAFAHFEQLSYTVESGESSLCGSFPLPKR